MSPARRAARASLRLRAAQPWLRSGIPPAARLALQTPPYPLTKRPKQVVQRVPEPIAWIGGSGMLGWIGRRDRDLRRCRADPGSYRRPARRALALLLGGFERPHRPVQIGADAADRSVIVACHRLSFLCPALEAPPALRRGPGPVASFTQRHGSLHKRSRMWWPAAVAEGDGAGFELGRDMIRPGCIGRGGLCLEFSPVQRRRPFSCSQSCPLRKSDAVHY